MRQYHVYILASHSRVLYVGITNDLQRRMAEHRSGAIPGFTRRYHVKALVYYDATADVMSAIVREKQLKRWPRRRKVRLIEAGNPEWRDLSADWFREDVERQAVS
jgi:putative endonuclease